MANYNPYNYGGQYYTPYQQPSYQPTNYGYQQPVAQQPMVQQPMVQQVQQPIAQQSQPNFMQLTFINGKDEATKYIVSPNSSIYLRDNDKNKLYIKCCDSTGKTSIEEYDLVKAGENSQNSQNLGQNKEAKEFVLKDDLQALDTKFEGKISKILNRLDKLQVKKIIEE